MNLLIGILVFACNVSAYEASLKTLDSDQQVLREDSVEFEKNTDFEVDLILSRDTDFV